MIIVLAIALLGCKEDCEKFNTGSVCFENTQSEDIRYQFDNTTYYVLPGEEECISTVPSGTYSVTGFGQKTGTKYTLTFAVTSCQNWEVTF